MHTHFVGFVASWLICAYNLYHILANLSLTVEPLAQDNSSTEFPLICSKPAPIAQLVVCPIWGTGGHEFDPGPRLNKVVKNGTSCSSLGAQIYRVELGLVDPVSG